METEIISGFIPYLPTTKSGMENYKSYKKNISAYLTEMGFPNIGSIKTRGFCGAEYGLSVVFYLGTAFRRGNDLDNLVKAFLDVLKHHIGIDDMNFYHINARKREGNRIGIRFIVRCLK